MYYKLLAKQTTTSFPTWGQAGNQTPISEVGGKSVTTLPPWPPNYYFDPWNLCERILTKSCI